MKVLKMIGQSLPLLFILLVIPCLAIGSNLMVGTPDTSSDKTYSDHGNHKEQESGESFKSFHKRNVFNEYGNLDLHYKSSTRNATSEVWFKFTSPAPPYLRTTTHDSEIKYKEEVQGFQLQQHSEDMQFIYQTFTDSFSRLGRLNNDSFSINHIGCFSTWEKQKTHLVWAAYDDSQLHITCASKCRQKGEELQVSFVKGAECQCAPIYGFDSQLKHDEFCNIPCPLKEFHPSNSSQELLKNPCGGNQGYSVYCISGPEKCDTLLQDASRQRTSMETQQINVLETKQNPIGILEKSCTKCKFTDSIHTNLCTQPYTFPGFDYFPVNSPEKCVEYCSSNVSYVMIGQQERVRLPTQYALLLWWKHQNSDLPICRCVNETIRELFIDLENSNECNMTCPGRFDAICGGKQNDHNEVFATVYCIDYSGNGMCGRLSTTSTNSPSYETQDPCLDEDIDCDDPETTTASGNTTDKTTGDEIITEATTSTPEKPTTVIPTTTPSFTTTSSQTTTMLPSSTTTTTVITTSSTSQVPITTPSNEDCNTKCKAIDRHGYYWEVCAGNQAIIRCAELNKNSNATGLAFWRCSPNGNFETVHPIVSNCTSVWLEKKHQEIEKIKDIGEADTFVKKLAESCKNAVMPNSSSRYYGHEIRDITFLVQQTVTKAKEFIETPGSNFSQLESLVDKAIDLNAFLIQYHEPWKDLPVPEKSVISTDIINNTEEALFHLTNEVHGKEYKRFFTINHSDVNTFLILADTFDKWASNWLNKSYEFPPTSKRNVHDSYIKLPDGWSKLVSNKQIEIAAMSIDSEYISNIMKGQYNIVSTSTLNENYSNSKLMNGRLISFTIMSTEENQPQLVQDASSVINQPAISFPGRGAEITFYHDIEAWGDDIQNVHRGLHDGELPKAVLGSTECVFWDTKTYTWSSKGCKILKASRYETVCECNHLTSFAVLMDVHRYVGKDFGLQLLTLILCPASEVALFISIIILSSINGLQKTRATITKNLSACLLVGNALVLFVLDRNYFNMNEGVCMGAAMITHFIFLAAFMWMLIEGIQLYRMVVHVFDSGRSYIKYFTIFAYGSPIIIIAITATTGFLNGDKPYGGDVYCWLEGRYIWSFMGPVAFVTTVNLVILFIALKTAYQVQQNKKNTPVFMMGKLRSFKTWFKGCLSLTVILGLTWVVGFFTLMKSPGGIIAAYIFTVLNASQGLFIFFFNCVFNEKVRSFTQRNLSTYLPSWLSSSLSSNPDPGGIDGSVYGKRPLSSMKSGDSAIVHDDKSRRFNSSLRHVNSSFEGIRSNSIISKIDKAGGPTTRRGHKSSKVDFAEARNIYISDIPAQRCDSIQTMSSLDSIPDSTGHISSDNSQNDLISKVRF